MLQKEDFFLCHQNMIRNSSAIPDYISALILSYRTTYYLLPFTFLKRNYFHHIPTDICLICLQSYMV